MQLNYRSFCEPVTVSQFDNGHASEIFERLNTEKQLVVLENDNPLAVILSQEEYERLEEIIEDQYLLIEAQERLKNSEGKKSYSREEIMEMYNITEEDLENAEDLEIE